MPPFPQLPPPLDKEDPISLFSNLSLVKHVKANFNVRLSYQRPGQIVYVDLEEIKSKEEANLDSDLLPPKYQETQYADIRH